MNISQIIDTTLRDGEQAPGVAFSIEEKVDIAKMLDQAGVHFIEAGTPVMGNEEKEAVKAIISLKLRARVVAWNRAVEGDIEESMSIGASNIHVSFPVSDIMIFKKLRKDRNWILTRLKEIASFVSSSGAILSIGAEDASRADEIFLLDFMKAAADGGAVRARYCDTVGICEPFGLYERIKRLIQKTDIPVEIHTHNDFGLAVANAMAGVLAGAGFVDTTVAGLGERAGNAALEDVAMGLKMLYGIDAGINPFMLTGLADMVSSASGRPLPVSKSIVGGMAFAHESGIHVDGVMKDPLTYEPFDPRIVGNRRRIVIGKHSGREALMLGTVPTPEE